MSWILCVSVVCFAGIVWKGVNSFFLLLCSSCCWHTKDENDYSGLFLLNGKEPNLIKMSPMQPSAYYFSILDVLYGCPGEREEIKVLHFKTAFSWILNVLYLLGIYLGFGNFAMTFFPRRWQHLFELEELCMHFLWGKTSNGFNKQIFFSQSLLNLF